MKSNTYSYQTSTNETRKGLFNIYQGRSGGIYLVMDNHTILLSTEQLKTLAIHPYELVGFDLSDFNAFYGKGDITDKKESAITVPINSETPKNGKTREKEVYSFLHH